MSKTTTIEKNFAYDSDGRISMSREVITEHGDDSDYPQTNIEKAVLSAQELLTEDSDERPETYYCNICNEEHERFSPFAGSIDFGKWKVATEEVKPLRSLNNTDIELLKDMVVERLKDSWTIYARTMLVQLIEKLDELKTEEN